MPELFNVQGFGPPRGFTLPSTCPWVDQRVSRLLPATRRPFKTRFPFGCAGIQLSLATESNSSAHYAKGTPSPRRAPTACKHTVSGTISLPCLGYFSPFPHGTSSLSVSQEYLALPDGPGRFIQGFTCPVLLRIPLLITSITYTGLSPSMVLLSSKF